MPGTPPPNPGPLFELAVAYWRSAALFAALELGVFRVLTGTPRTAGDLAQDLGVPERGLTLLLDGLTTIGLATRDATTGAYRATPLASAWLHPETPGNLAVPIRFNAQAWEPWGKLAAAIRADAPPLGHQHILGGDAEATRTFVLAMHQRAMGAARALAGRLPLGDCHTLLDLGGGPGTYSRLLAERHPALRCTVLDLAPILAVASGLHGDSPAAARLTWYPGDLFAEPPALPADTYDAVLLSGVAHRVTGEALVTLLRRAGERLRPGGLLALCDLFTGGPASGPVAPELFSLHLLLTSNTGASLDYHAITGQLAAAGLRLDSRQALPHPLPHTLVLARRA